MTDYDAQLESALALLSPPADDRAAWDDVVRRAGGGPRFRWKLAAIAVAGLLAAGAVAGALAAGLLSGSLDRLSAWMGDQPGAPAPEQQATFDRENAASYAHFPSGTRVGRLLSFELNGDSYDLLGFRDGPNLCLRIVPTPIPPNVSVPECVPQRELTRLAEPVAVVGGHVRTRLPDGSGLTMLYGLAADDVRSIDVLEGGELLGSATVDNNAFLLAARDRPGSPVEGPALVIRAHAADGTSADFPVELGVMFPSQHPEDLPGPDHVDRVLTNGSIGWLENGENRGEPFQWPEDYPQRILHVRMLTPDPSSSFRLALADAKGTNWQTNGKWLCLASLWPLVPGSFSSMCIRAESIDGGLNISGAWPSAAQQFPLWIGMASDDIARMKLFYRDGSTAPVALQDNVFTFYTRRGETVKLVAYDHEDRVVKVEIVGGRGGSLRMLGLGR